MTNRIDVAASPEQVFDVLDDAHAYPRWVVGTRRIRRVDAGWPAVGAGFHHAVGTAAAELHDSSIIRERARPSRLVLEVRFRPTGVATVVISVRPEGSVTRVELRETPTDGPAAAIPDVVATSLLWSRNWLSLQRLRHEVERRASPRNQDGGRAPRKDGGPDEPRCGPCP